MGRIPFNEIAGQLINGQVVCPECISNEEAANVKEDELITWESVKEAEAIFFCDRCKARL